MDLKKVTDNHFHVFSDSIIAWGSLGYDVVSLPRKRFRGFGSKVLPCEKKKGKRERKEAFLPSPLISTPFFLILALAPFLRGQNTENPVPWSFSAPQTHGNACYAGYDATDVIFV